MTAVTEIREIKNNDDLSNDERIWKAIERLAELVDAAPAEGARQAGQEAARAARRSGF